VIVSSEGNAAKLVDRPTSRVNRPQGGDKPSQARGRPAQISDLGQGRELAVQPATHCPRPRIPLAGPAVPDRNRDRQRQMRGKDRDPTMLFFYLPLSSDYSDSLRQRLRQKLFARSSALTEHGHR
jgi:hypothetical protein